MAALVFKYPVVLTNKEWQKKKPLLAKGKSTGIGDKLVALEKQFGATSFGKLDPDVLAGETLDPTTFAKKRDVLIKALVAQGAKLKPCVDEVVAAVKASEADFAKDKSVSKYFETVQLAVKGLRSELLADGDYLTQLRADMTAAFKARLDGDVQIQTAVSTGEKLPAHLAKLISDIRKVEATPTLSNAHNVFDGDNSARQMTTACNLWDQIVARRMPETAQAVYAGRAMNDFYNLPWLSDMANESSSIATNRMRQSIPARPEARVVSEAMMQLSQSALNLRALVQHYAAVIRVVKGFA